MSREFFRIAVVAALAIVCSGIVIETTAGQPLAALRTEAVLA